ncbi:MAG: hypothetical protein ACSHXB_19745 [Sulfitobacter sp.]
MSDTCTALLLFLKISGRNVNNVREVAKIGPNVATASASVIKALMKHPLINAGPDQFTKRLVGNRAKLSDFSTTSA